jgi:hypothetical protein
MTFMKTKFFYLVCSFSLTLVAFFVFSQFWNSEQKQNDLLISSGFDFRKLRLNNTDFAEPKIGEKIDLSKFKDKNGKTMNEVAKDQYILLAVVDELCQACDMAKDSMAEIRQTVKQLDFGYYPIFFTLTKPDNDFLKYSQKLGFENYFCRSSEVVIPQSLSSMVTPTHISVSKNGVILQLWYGTNKDKEVRKVMANQISSDLLLINDVVKTLPETES